MTQSREVKQTTKTNKFAHIVRFVENEASDSTLNEEETVKEDTAKAFEAQVQKPFSDKEFSKAMSKIKDRVNGT